MGTTGCGKTHLAIGILKAVIEKGYTGYYCNVVDFFTRLRDTFAGDTEYDEMDLLDKVARVNLLVLDDLGAEQPSVWKLDRLYALVNKRYEQNSPIIVTTNKLDVNDLEDFIGPRIVSRLCEMCQIMDKFPNADYRKKDLGK
ncbi:MAG: DNA replication protein DnaC [candidate division BRC1 bacterium ADurb.Bin183]|nr:MAG: DNA replication protein DnaC [candidate division BRC1 bacterium ADurb.Bin183]